MTFVIYYGVAREELGRRRVHSAGSGPVMDQVGRVV
jgi:hypothetical protein